MKRLPLALLGSFLLTTPVWAEDAGEGGDAGETTEAGEDDDDLIEKGKQLLEAAPTENAEDAEEAEEAEEAEVAKAPVTEQPPGKDELIWEGVYKRSGKTLKAGEWMGIAGGAGIVLGGVLFISGGANALGGLGGAAGGDVAGGSDDIASGAGTMILGYGTLIVGGLSLAIGPALVAGGSIRQAKAIRSVNPEAPAPLYGYATWGMWGLAISGQAGAGTVPLLIGSYVTGGIQKGKNRLNWDMATAQRLEHSKSTFTVDLVPFSYEGNRGLALTGTF
jgi:hypothetical protein